MSIADIIERAFAKLPQTLPCDFLGLVTARGAELSLKAMMPRDYCRIDGFPADSPARQVIARKQAAIFNVGGEDLGHVRIAPGYPAPLRALAVAPMFQRDEVIGALIVASASEGA